MLPASVEPSSRILKTSPVKVALVSAPVDATDVVYAVAVGPKVATTAPTPAFVPVCAMPTAMPACAVVSVPLALEDCVTATAAWGGRKQCPPDRNSASALFGIAVVTEPAIREPQKARWIWMMNAVRLSVRLSDRVLVQRLAIGVRRRRVVQGLPALHVLMIRIVPGRVLEFGAVPDLAVARE